MNADFLLKEHQDGSVCFESVSHPGTLLTTPGRSSGRLTNFRVNLLVGTSVWSGGARGGEGRGEGRGGEGRGGRVLVDSINFVGQFGQLVVM